MAGRQAQGGGGQDQAGALLQALGAGGPQAAVGGAGMAPGALPPGMLPAQGLPGAGAESPGEEMGELLPLLMALLSGGAGPGGAGGGMAGAAPPQHLRGA